MIKLSIILESILTEMSQNATLYHRSTQKYKVGDVVKARGREYVTKKYFERALEYYRKENFPNEPSRLTCVFASVIPRSRFRQKGILYTVKLNTNKWLFTDSKLIDTMDGDFNRTMNANRYDFSDDMYKNYTDEQLYREFLDRYDAKRYWSGTKRADTESIEILADSFIVTGIEDDNVMINRGDKVMSTKSISVNLSGYFKSSEFDSKYVIDELNKFIDGDLKIEKQSYGEDQFSINGKVTLKSNVTLYVIDINDPMENYNKSDRKEYNKKPAVSVAIHSPWTEEKLFPYITMTTTNPKDIKEFKRI